MSKDFTPADYATGDHAALSGSDDTKTIGGFLRKHRQIRGESLDDVAKKLHIHASTIQAIEEDNPKALPAEVFARGFVKNYARYLGVDPNEALTWYVDQNAGLSNTTEKINTRKVLVGEVLTPARTFSVRRFLALFIAVLALIFVGFLVVVFFNSPSPPVDTSKQQEISPQAPVEQPPPIITPRPGNPLSGAEPGAESLATGQAPAATQSGIQDSEATKKDDRKQVTEPSVIQGNSGLSPRFVDGAGVSSAAEAMPQSLSGESKEAIYVLEAKFTEVTWISVQTDKGEKSSVMYRPGDYAVWKARENISLHIGNAGGIALTLNGKPVSITGKSGESVRMSFPAE